VAYPVLFLTLGQSCLVGVLTEVFELAVDLVEVLRGMFEFAMEKVDKGSV
jgi:hypothetical protein